MFTQQTISALSSLHDLTYKSADLKSQTSGVYRTHSRDLLLGPLSSGRLKQAAAAQHDLFVGALVEGLFSAKDEFVGTPFEQTINEILAGYRSASTDARLDASVALASLERQASAWLKEQADAALPLLKYTVGSAFGSLTVAATSPEKARLVAAAQHYKCAVEDLAGDELRGFTNGVLVF